MYTLSGSSAARAYLEREEVSAPLLKQLADKVLELRGLRFTVDDPQGRLVSEPALLCWMDWAGVVLYGLRDRLGQSLRGLLGNPISLMRALEGSGDPFCNLPVAFSLSFLLGAVAHATELDDTLPGCMVHAGAPVIAAALTVGIAKGSSGEDFLRAIVAGYEVVDRLGRTLNAPPMMRLHRKGFHPTGVLGAFGAAAAAAEILSLERLELINSLALTTSMGSGILEFLGDGSDTKAIHAGKAAADGILATYLAASGLRGPARALEGRDGFFRAFVDGEVTLDAITAPTAPDRLAARTAMRKYYACCHHCHPAIEALARIRSRSAFEPRQIRSIDVKVPSMAAYQIAIPAELKQRPRNALEARLSLPYCVAAWIVVGHLSPEVFTPQYLFDAEILQIASLVRCAPDEEHDERFRNGGWPVTVVVELAGGGQIAETLHLGGSPPEFSEEYERLKRKCEVLVTHRCGELENLWSLFERVAESGPRTCIDAFG
jgi:2-methylcitrate dehydratase PrpD